jgi:hypothetical protein
MARYEKKEATYMYICMYIERERNSKAKTYSIIMIVG